MGTEPFGGCNLLHPGLCSGMTFAAHPEANIRQFLCADACELSECTVFVTAFTKIADACAIMKNERMS